MAIEILELFNDEEKRKKISRKELGESYRAISLQSYTKKIKEKLRMAGLGKLTLYRAGRAIFRFTIAHPDNIRLATQGPLIHKFLPKKGRIVLDLGCGTGRYAERLTQRANQIIGLDIDMENLLKLKKRHIKVSLVCASAEYRLPFRDSIFDFILCTEVLEHLTGHITALKEIRRVLQKNGEILISVPIPPPVYQDPAHKRDGYYLGELKDLLKKTGFEVNDIGYCMLIFSRLMLRFGSQFIRLFRFSPPILPFIYLEHLIFHNHQKKDKFKPFNLVIKARKRRD